MSAVFRITRHGQSRISRHPAHRRTKTFRSESSRHPPAVKPLRGRSGVAAAALTRRRLAQRSAIGQKEHERIALHHNDKSKPCLINHTSDNQTSYSPIAKANPGTNATPVLTLTQCHHPRSGRSCIREAINHRPLSAWPNCETRCRKAASHLRCETPNGYETGIAVHPLALLATIVFGVLASRETAESPDRVVEHPMGQATFQGVDPSPAGDLPGSYRRHSGLAVYSTASLSSQPNLLITQVIIARGV